MFCIVELWYLILEYILKLIWLCFTSFCFPGGISDKEPICQCRRLKRCGFDPWVGKIHCSRLWQPTWCSCLENPRDRGAWWAMVHRGHKESYITKVSSCTHTYIILMCISCFMFFASELFLVVYFVYILDYGNDVRHKVNSSSFLIWVQNTS